jgi:hypothetical protein
MYLEYLDMRAGFLIDARCCDGLSRTSAPAPPRLLIPPKTLKIANFLFVPYFADMADFMFVNIRRSDLRLYRKILNNEKFFIYFARNVGIHGLIKDKTRFRDVFRDGRCSRTVDGCGGSIPCQPRQAPGPKEGTPTAFRGLLMRRQFPPKASRQVFLSTLVDEKAKVEESIHGESSRPGRTLFHDPVVLGGSRQ